MAGFQIFFFCLIIKLFHSDLNSKRQAICLQKLQAVVINKDHTKVKRLFEKQTVTPWAFHSVSVRTLSVTNKHSGTQATHRKARLEPAIRDAQNVSPVP